MIKTAIASLLLLAMSVSAKEGDTCPEIPSSVVFKKSDPQLTLSDCRDRAVVILFFQSWCPICNKWAPEAIKSLQESEMAKNPSVLFVAVKTDGGNLDQAEAFFKGKGGDPNRWIIGIDPGAAMLKAINGKDGLWEMAVIGQDQKIKTLTSALSSLSKPDSTLQALNLSQQYGGDMGAAIKFFAVRKYATALSLAQKSKDKAQAIAFKADIDKLLSVEVKELTDIVSKSDLSAGDAWNAIARCKAIDVPVTGLAELKKMAAKIEMRPDVVKERLADQTLKQASSAFAKANAAKSKNEEKARADYGAQLKRVQQNYPGTQAAIKAKTLMEQAGL